MTTIPCEVADLRWGGTGNEPRAPTLFVAFAENAVSLPAGVPIGVGVETGDNDPSAGAGTGFRAWAAPVFKGAATLAVAEARRGFLG